MYRQNIKGSMAHAAMLSATGIIGADEADTLIAGLEGILSDLESGALSFDPACEDIHMFVEEVLTARVGDVGKKLHTARSRNDQVALDLRMYLMEEIDAIAAMLKQLIATVTDKADCYQATIMPGYGRFLFPISVTLRQNSAPGKIPGGAVLLVSALRQIRLP